MELEVGDIVMCSVERISGTVVFVKIPLGDREIEGSIITSEIAPGRIRNLREYVVPKKRIVCKVLRITPQGNVELSLRRVTQKEKKEIIEKDKQEKSYINILKVVLGDRAEEIIDKIKKKEKIYDFLQEAKENPKILENFVGKDSEKILEILKSQKQRKATIKKEISLTTTKPNGIESIKEILMNVKDAEIKYISAGRYSIKTESVNAKTADHKLKEILSNIEKASKQKEIDFIIKEK